MRGVRFNNGISASAGLTVSFTRNNATRDPLGVARSANQPRYAPTRLVCGTVADSISHYAPGGSCYLWDAGYASNNTTPVWIAQNATGGTLHLWSGTFVSPSTGSSFDVATNSGGASTRATGVPAALVTAGATTDLFKNQPAIDGYDDECWSPYGAAICHGLIAIFCQVRVKDSGDDGTSAAHWAGQYVGVVFCKVSSWLASPGTGFFGRSRSGQLHTNTAGSIGASWACRWDKMDRDGSAPLKAWFSGTDYQNNPNKNGGVAFVIPAARTTTTSDDWTVDGAAEIVRQTIAGNLRHYHAMVLGRVGSTGIAARVAIGDGASNQAVVGVVLSDEGSTTAIGTNYRTGLTVAADAVNWYSGTPTNWTVPTLPGYGGNGVVQGAIGDGVVNPGTDSATSYRGNQFVGVAQNTGGGWVNGADESGDGAISGTFAADDDTQQQFSPVWCPQRVTVVAPSGAQTALDTKWTLFYIDELNPLTNGGGWVTNSHPGINYAVTGIGSRIIYSPDGQIAQEIYPHGASVLYAIRYMNGRIYYGDGLLIRSIAVPAATSRVRPLLIGPGGANYGATSPTVTDIAGSGQVTITEVAYASAPSGLPALDSTKTVWHITHTGQTSASCCTVLIGREIPEGTKEIMVKFYIRNPTIAERTLDSVSHGLGLSYALTVGKDSDGSQSNTSGSSLHANTNVNGEWRLVTIRANIQQLAKDISASNDYRVTLRILAANGEAGPLDFYFAPHGVYAVDPDTGDETGGYPITRGTTGADEVLTVEGLDLPLTGAWTLLIDGFIPRDALWGAEHAITFHGAAVKVSDTTTTLTGGPATDWITGGLLRIGTSANSGLCGLPISGYNTGTKLATHEALTGVANGAVTATVLMPRKDTVNSIDRPRELFAVTTADGQTGILVFATTSRQLGGTDAHGVGMVPIVGGAPDWTQPIETGTSIEWFTPGDALRLVLKYDVSDGYFYVGWYDAGRSKDAQGDFGSLIANFLGTETFTKLRLGGLATVTPLEVAYVSADETTALTGEELADLFGELESEPQVIGGGSSLARSGRSPMRSRRLLR